MTGAFENTLAAFLAPKDSLQLVQNHETNAGRLAEGKDPVDFKPVCRLFLPNAQLCWYLAEADPHSRLAFGLTVQGANPPTLGYTPIDELEYIRGPGKTRVTRDDAFEAKYGLDKYFALARANRLEKDHAA